MKTVRLENGPECEVVGYIEGCPEIEFPNGVRGVWCGSRRRTANDAPFDWIVYRPSSGYSESARKAVRDAFAHMQKDSSARFSINIDDRDPITEAFAADRRAAAMATCAMPPTPIQQEINDLRKAPLCEMEDAPSRETLADMKQRVVDVLARRGLEDWIGNYLLILLRQLPNPAEHAAATPKLVSWLRVHNHAAERLVMSLFPEIERELLVLAHANEQTESL